MEGEWRSSTIGSIIAESGGSIKTGPFGTTLKACEYSTEGVPLISVGEVDYGALRVHQKTPRAPQKVVERLPAYILDAGDIVFGRKGAVDRSARVKPEQAGWFLGSDGIRLRLPNSCDSRFIAYQLQTSAIRSWLVQHASGTTMASLNQSIIERIPIMLPPLPEQRGIAHILGTLDDKIELNRRMSETLEAMARALFKSWFVDFDPVRAKMEGRWWKGESLPGLPAGLREVFPDRLVESELGEIPEGWEVRPFSETVEVLGGGTPKTTVPEYWGGDIPWFSVVDAPTIGDVWVVDTDKKVTQAGVEASSTKVLPVGITIISARGTVGRLALVGVPMAMNQSCYGLRGKQGTKGFFNYYSTLTLVSVLQQQAHGSVFDTITRDTLVGVKTVVPPGRFVNEFEQLAAPFLDALLKKLIQSRTLSSLRDTLLPKLISGEIRVKDAKSFITAVVT